MLWDMIVPGLTVLFIGYNPSLRSAEIGHHFAGRNNGFWRILADAGLTPERLQPEEDMHLLKLGMGLTNIVARPTRAASDLTAAEYRQGAEQLREKLDKFKPRIACYVGIGVYKVFTKRKQVDHGTQAEEEVPGVIDFVAPSTSGLNRMLYQDQLQIYRQLSNLVSELKAQDES